MDPYDAIREQLESAQARAQEALRERLERVISALEDAKAEVQQAASGAPQDLFPLGGVEDAIADFAASAAEEFRPGITLEIIRRLDAARSQSDLLQQLMTVLTDHASRAVVLVIRSQAVNAWSGVGFQFSADLESWRGEVGDSEALQRLVTEETPVVFAPGEDALLGRWLAGEEAASAGLLVPVSLRGKLMGAVYADRIAEGPWDPDMVQALVALSCWLIDTLHHRVAAPSPMVVAPVDVAEAVPVGAAAAPQPEWAEEPQLEPEPELEEGEEHERQFEVEVVPEAEPAEEAIAETPEPGEELEFADELEFPEEPELPESARAAAEPELEVPATAEIGDAEFDPSATVQVDIGEVEVAPPEMPEELELEEMHEEVVVEEAPVEPPAPAAAAVTPPPVKPVAPPAPEQPRPSAAEGAPHLSPEEETRHEEARRFARLLVSEIKLYNERDVEKGRTNHDLYQRLKEDIDRSREMYEKRIAPDVRAARDYFQDELVRILADGNPDALGV